MPSPTNVILLVIWLAISISPAVAQQTTTQAAQAEAVRLYPELGKAGSPINQRFLKEVDEAKRANDPVLAKPDWPVTIAKRVAGESAESVERETRIFRRHHPVIESSEQLIGLGAGVVFGSLIGAIFVRMATSMVAGFTPLFGTAWLVAFVGASGGLIAGYLTGAWIAANGGVVDTRANIFLIVLGFFIQSAVNGGLLKDPESGSIGLLKGSLVALVQLLVTAVLAGIIALIIYAVVHKT